mmetsp:Transcript_37296/g.78137  ORF Transcript_37296/g.78137 Transcript_37296/m.78137 type:complete len:115 (+) Transcript_37296:409-753(+)
MHEVIDVTSSPEINGGEDLTKVKGARIRAASITEAVHIIASVVGHNGNKSMRVSQQLRKEKVLHGINVHLMSSSHVFTNGKKRRREKEEVDEEIGPDDNREEFPEGVERRSSAE